LDERHGSTSLDDQVTATIRPVGGGLVRLRVEAEFTVEFCDVVAALADYSPADLVELDAGEMVASQVAAHGLVAMHERAAAVGRTAPPEWLALCRQRIREILAAPGAAAPAA
jgi:hypothetical protein